MRVTVNQKVYQIDDIETSIVVLDFLVEEEIFIINKDSFLDWQNYARIEIEGYDDLVNPKDVVLEDGQVIYTLSHKVIAYLNELVVSNTLCCSMDTIELSDQNYHILICDPQIYEENLISYKDKGFQDIINLKFAEMIYYLEVSHQLLLGKSQKLNHPNPISSWVVKHNLLNYPLDRLIDVKSPEEIAAILIKEYYQKILHIEKNIHITYITNSHIPYVTIKSQNKMDSFIDQVVLMNQVEIVGNGSSYDGSISKEIYTKETLEMNISYDAMIVFQLFEQMGFKSESFETTMDKNILKICATYKEVSFQICISPRFLSTEELDAFTDVDFIFIVDNHENLQYKKMTAFLDDYNVNRIYKKFLLYPSYSTICRRQS